MDISRPVTVGMVFFIFDSHALRNCHALGCSYPDVWRRLHPDIGSVYTVWDEKTFARSINTVRYQPSVQIL